MSTDRPPHEAPPPDLSGFGRRRGAGLANRLNRRSSHSQEEPAPSNEGNENEVTSQKEDRPSVEEPPPPYQKQEVPVTTTPPEVDSGAEEGSSGAPPAPSSASLSPPSVPAVASDATRVVTPTVLSVDAEIVARFEKVSREPGAPTHTGIVLEALREHHGQLAALVQQRRPQPRVDDLFPYRQTPRSRGKSPSEQRRLPLRIRPLAAELAVIDRLRDECRAVVGNDVSRSELVAAALDAYLPPLRRARNR